MLPGPGRAGWCGGCGGPARFGAASVSWIMAHQFDGVGEGLLKVLPVADAMPAKAKHSSLDRHSESRGSQNIVLTPDAQAGKLIGSPAGRDSS